MLTKRPTARPDATLFPAAACQLAEIRGILKDDGPRPDLPDKQAWTGAALSQIDDLHTLGFTQSQCLEAVTAMGTLDRDALIEWLLLHLAPKDIPRVFALQSASESGDVAVLHKADPAARESARALGAMAREAPEPRGPALQELKAEAAAHEPASDQKAWILQHLEAAGSSSGDSDDSRSRSSSSSVEDWEVWGAPEEVAARRAQRSRAEQLGALSRGELAAQLGRELQEALRAGAKAKGSRDSAGQRTAGEAIRRVKAEIAAFALSPEELDVGARPASPDPVAKGAVETGTPPSAQHPAVPPEDDWVVLGEDSGSEASGAEDKVEPGPKAPFQAAPQAAPESRPPQDEPVFDLFGETPKQALARYCQSQGLAAPRYEKLQAGGGRNDGEGGIRYSVTLEQLLPGKPTPKKVTTRCQLAVLEDGWDTIEEAQHAVATRALYLTTPESLGLWQKLPPDHREMDEEELSNLQARLESVYSDLHAQERARRLADVVPGEGGPSARGGSSRSQLPDPEWVARESARLRRQRADWLASDAGRAWASRRAQLPIHPLGPRLTAALEAGDVAIVASETGSGKTTQVPQFLLDAAIDLLRGTATSVVCTQPRRIAATSVAARVAAERGEAAPGQPGGQVGYQVRFDSAMTASTRILFCTTGILLRRLASDPQLDSVSHVVVDELVLMSATLDFGALSEYFGGAPVLSSPGRTFPVTQRYLEDAYEATGYALAEDSHCALRAGSDAALRARQAAIWRAGAGSQGVLAQGWGDDGARPGAVLNPHYHPGLYGHLSPVTIRNLKRVDEEALDLDLAEALVEHIAEKGTAGAILVFLPGMAEISALQDRLARESVDRAPGSRLVLPLHSSTPADEQRLAFLPAPEGTRKIVLATNIAETSVTIEDVVHVVDCGRLNERRYDAAARTSPAVVAAALAWALKPALAVAEPPGTAETGGSCARPRWRDVSGEVAVHPSSVIHPLTHTTLHHPFVTFLDKMRTSRTFLRDCTVVSPLAVLLFGDGLRLHPEVGAATLDGDIRIRQANTLRFVVGCGNQAREVPAVTGALVKQVRLGLEAMLSSMAGRQDKAPTPAELALVDAAAMLLQAEDGVRSWG
ncbi:ATP-dependent RNA helicase DHX29 [Auxenochlorella protothecoides]|uniref:ATP-dependent RNA helicase DHX29 n=1 Tax=Auxenochlorella protothecoides TaxID=3075 RepID=A0A087SK47_AUXPR|nr:ATP-dependent RNA helicase DHX29 [Auxenochlorella protothecoides]KFM26101.1 ATP-dependent RNA helicase DHX29 [Auxenochlorella protothecoides]